MADVNTFVEKTLELLNLEREAEITEATAFYDSADNSALEKKGVCLSKLIVFSRRTGLYGRTLLTLGKGKTSRHLAESSLPAHRITPGDIVGLSYSTGDSNVSELSSGIVTRVSASSIIVAFDESLDSQLFDEDALLRLTRLANDITHKRMKRALNSLCNTSSFPCTYLVNVMFGNVPTGEPLNLSNLLGQAENGASKSIVFFNENLNHSQRLAVQFALTRREVGIIHGPPGTGKTTTVVEVIIQAVKNCHLKVLACAPSNIAVDNIVERIAKHKVKAVRLGHPARLLEAIRGYSLDAILDSSDGTAIVKDVRRDIDVTQSKMKSCQNPGERSRLRAEIKSLRRELKEREDKALKQILLNADVILATNVSASEDGPLRHLPRDHFDLVVIDEAAQSLEAACWIPLLWASRCILAGDHQQLPPTIVSREAAKRGLDQTLMERLIKLLGDEVVHMLTTQYRMNEAIMQWSSEKLYDGRLLADVSVAQHLLCDLPGVKDAEVTTVALLLIDTTGCDLYEIETSEEESKGNEGEAEVVALHVEALVSSGVKQSNIGIITPYNLQVELLRSRLSTKYPAIEIKSVDGFQGREKEAIVISLVRSNNKGEIGFLAENRRVNVAVTRARRHLTVVGDSSTVTHDPFLNSLVSYISDNGEVWSAEQYRSQISGNSVLPRINAKNRTQNAADAKSKNQNVKTSKGKGRDKNGGKSKNKNNDKNQLRKVEETPRYKNWKDWKESYTFTEENRMRKDKKREKLEEEIKAFLKDPTRTELEFSANLSSEERFMVHCIAEELGLNHISKGTGTDRFIAVTKKTTPPDGISDSDFVVNRTETICTDAEEKRDENTTPCSNCGKYVPIFNLGLHGAKCQWEKRQAPKKFPEKTPVKDKTKSNKKGAKVAGKKLLAEKEDEDQGDSNLDELLAEFKRRDSECAFPGCIKSILTVGQKCRCCTNTYCLGHHIPEVHGCTQAAKAHARRDFLSKSTGNHKQPLSKTSNETHLHRKLESKLKNLESKRKTKQKQQDKH